MKFAPELKEDAFRPREMVAGKDARTLASDILAMSQEEFSAAFRKSPMKRAKLSGLKRNAAVVLGNGDAADDVEHEHAVWELERIAACLRHVMLPRAVDASGE